MEEFIEESVKNIHCIDKYSEKKGGLEYNLEDPGKHNAHAIQSSHRVLFVCHWHKRQRSGAQPQPTGRPV
jgi:hypothetical protein